ncbi:DUF1330 domain-containing protein [Nannocystaceae bacterium ST9]
MAELEHTLLVGLWVADPEGYRRYRAGMTPILARYGGRFGYDFVIAEVLRSEVDTPINRVFTLKFPDRATAKAFFADPEYLEVRAAHFEPSVTHRTAIAEF